MRLHLTSFGGLLASVFMMTACSSDDAGGGNGNVGGTDGTAGSKNSGGMMSTGATMTTGGATSNMATTMMGGMMNTGGMSTTGGMMSTGMTMSTGGMMMNGGSASTGTMMHTGGMMMSGGSSNMGTMMHSGGMMSAGGVSSMGGMSTSNTLNTGGMMDAGEVTHFKLRVENVSAYSALPTLIAPGVYAVTTAAVLPFTRDAVASPGLELAAEDANPAVLATETMGLQGVSSSNVFNIPAGANSPAPLHPGDAYEISFEAMPGDVLHFASMFGQSNDTFLTVANGIALFDSAGKPLSGDKTLAVSLWDAGSERNEAPGMGPNQAPRQAAPNTGPTEAGVCLRTDGTRAIPIPGALVDVSVSLSGTDYSVTLKNISDKGPLMSPLSPAFYALHDANYRYFTEGAAASAGLERIAEEGNTSVLVQEANTAGAIAATAGTAAYGPGSSVMFTVTPTIQKPRLSLAMMVGQTNDVFVGTRPQGVPLLDGSGAPRPAMDVQRDIANLLAVWDAGTEANQAPGVGGNQAPRQPVANTGPVDPDPTVRLYADSTNDFAHLSEKVDVKVMHATGTTFDVVVSNMSADTAFPLTLSPVAWVVSSDSFAEFALGSAASPGVEHLAEDGASATLLAEWNANSGIGSSGVAGTVPFMSGSSVSFQVTADAMHRYFNLAAMLVPSNDTFMSLGATGVALLDSAGSPRMDSDIAADIMASLAAYESGTEANQGSALGPDMAPYQASPNTGANEGSGKVRATNGVWPFPTIDQIVRVTLTSM
jgi:hypothetical protein